MTFKGGARKGYTYHGEQQLRIMERNFIYPRRNSTKPNAYELGKSGVMG